MSIWLQYRTRVHAPSDIYEHLEFLHDTAVGYDAPVIIELGVRTGNSTAAFLAAIEGKGGHLWSVDKDTPKVPAAWLETGNWTLTVADDTAATTVDFIRKETHSGADVLFIDTSHEYQHTLDELAAYVPMVKPGGVVLLHDTEWEDREVTAALDKFCPEHGLEWENRTGNNGMGVVHIPGD